MRFSRSAASDAGAPATDPVGTWFAGEAARARGRVTLEDALLGDRFGAYFRHRLRFFLIRYLVASVLAVIKILVLHRLLGAAGFLHVLPFLVLAGLAAGAWWGALEVLRTSVRDLHRWERPAVVAREIASWVVAALVLGLALAAATLVAVVARLLGPPPGGLPGPIDLAIIAVVLRAAFDLPVRAYHAGAYAVRRVYRPLPSILLLEGASVAAMVGLAPLLGAYAFAAAELALASLFAVVSIRYAAGTHRVLGFDVGEAVRAAVRPRRLRREWRRRGSLARDIAATVRAATAPAAAGMLMAVDSLAVLAVVGAITARHSEWLAVLVAAVAPSIRAGFDWSQLVYFDLTRLGGPVLRSLRSRLDRAALRLAVVNGVGFGVVALGVAVLVSVLALGRAEPDLLALVPLAVGSSLLGLGQMEAFTDRAYGRAIAGGAVFAAAVACLPVLAAARLGPLPVLAVAVFVAAGITRALRHRPSGRGIGGRLLLPPEWGARLAAQRRPLVLATARVRQPAVRPGASHPPGLTHAWLIRRLARDLAAGLDEEGFLTVLDGTLMWFEPAARVRLTPGRAMAIAAGRLVDVKSSKAPDAVAAVAVARTWMGTRDRGEDAFPDVATAAREFVRLVPAGIVFDPTAPAPESLRTLPMTERRLVYWAALEYVRTLRPSRDRGRFEVTAWCADGTLRTIFAAERGTARRPELAEWRRRLRAANVVPAAVRVHALSRMQTLPERSAAPVTGFVDIRPPMPILIAARGRARRLLPPWR